MTVLFVFAATLFVAVLLSGIAEESILSVSVLFLASGFLAGSGLLFHIPRPNQDLLRRLAEIALFSVLFTDGTRTGGLNEIRRFWHLPGRALLIGMPLTIGGIALIGHYLVQLTWRHSLLLGAALSPTDPVFVSAIFRFRAVPDRVKRLLNIESGLNDGLALPFVILLLPELSRTPSSTALLVGDLALGLAIGTAIAWVGVRLEESRFFGASGLFQPLNAFALGLLVLAVCYRTGANLFLGAFAAGIGVATFSAPVTKSFQRFGELVTELLKLAAVLIFGMMIAPRFFTPLPGREYVFILLAVFAVRPVAIVLSLLGTGMRREEMLAAGWFGPKGFASVVYGLMILQAGLPHLAHLIGLAVTASIVIFSSTDILVGRWFERRDGRAKDTNETLGRAA